MILKYDTMFGREEDEITHQYLLKIQEAIIHYVHYAVQLSKTEASESLCFWLLGVRIKELTVKSTRVNVYYKYLLFVSLISLI